jgi:hypothetical protein
MFLPFTEGERERNNPTTPAVLCHHNHRSNFMIYKKPEAYVPPETGLAAQTEAGSKLELHQVPDSDTEDGWMWLISLEDNEEKLVFKLSDDGFNTLIRMKGEFDFLTRGITE